MHFRTPFLAALSLSLAAAAPSQSLPAAAALSPRQAPSGDAIVVNACSFQIFVRSQTNTATGALQVLNPGDAYLEGFQTPADGSGVSVIVARQDPVTGGDRLQFEYSVSGANVFYDLSIIDGDPFVAEGFVLFPGDASCPTLRCAPGDGTCGGAYGAGQTKVCSANRNLQLNVCGQ